MRLTALIIGLFLFIFINAPVLHANSELIIQYKKGQSPAELNEKVNRKNVDSNLSKLIAIAERFISKATIEKKVKRMEQTDNQAGVISKSKLFEGEIHAGEIFLVEISDSVSVENALVLYSTLPEVEYVEESLLLSESL